LLCGNDRMALGAYLALGELGLRIPADVSVMGFDDQLDLASDLHPGLTTVRLPYYAMGAWAAEQLFPRSQAPDIGQAYLPCPVVLRDSVGPPSKTAG
jgi:LacI family transcriptional regulator